MLMLAALHRVVSLEHVLASGAESRDVTAHEDDTCAVCLGPLQSARTLPCGHTYCAGCLWTVAASARLASAGCPLCRTPFRLGDTAATSPADADDATVVTATADAAVNNAASASALAAARDATPTSASDGTARRRDVPRRLFALFGGQPRTDMPRRRERLCADVDADLFMYTS